MPDPSEAEMRPGFLGSRGQVRDAIYSLGCRACSYSYGDQWNRCDCKYGIRAESKNMTSEQTGCPELRSLYWIVESMTDEEWAMLVRRAGGVPSGFFAASASDMEKRLHAADAAARMAADNISQVRRMLTLEKAPPSPLVGTDDEAADGS